MLPLAMEKGLKLFGVQIFREREGEEGEEEVMRKSASTGNLVSCGVGPTGENGGAENSGYQSDGGLVKSSRKRRRSAAQERKRGRSSRINLYSPVFSSSNLLFCLIILCFPYF